MKKLNAFTSGLAFVLAIAFNLLLQVVTVVVLEVIPDAATKEWVSVGSVLLLQGCNLLAVFVVMRKSKDESKKIIHKPSIINILWLAIAVATVMVGFSSISTMFSNMLSNNSINGANVDYSGAALVVFVINAIVIAPICEELLFRHAVFTGFARNFSPIVAAILSATSFALFHMNIHQTVFQFALGLLLSFVLYKTGNVLYCIVGHMFSNLLAVCMPSSVTAFITANGWFIWVAIALAVGATIACLFIVKKFKQEVPDKFAKTEITASAKTTSIILYVLSAFLCVLFILAAFVPNAQ